MFEFFYHDHQGFHQDTYNRTDENERKYKFIEKIYVCSQTLLL